MAVELQDIHKVGKIKKAEAEPKAKAIKPKEDKAEPKAKTRATK